ncbi:hypothetical protein SLEP1_g57372 [Rubroshorea leprosula]|uniref:Uncharacterized protein n=1 Tax=Rubroshorea leprosula TaxID=152421 RepID=A0AAV5MLI4_9ROSI|nr:hypothetical protein SLEP1_g57372 [Rubroshorea leprosula]
MILDFFKDYILPFVMGAILDPVINFILSPVIEAILDFVTNSILPPVIEALDCEVISRAYGCWTASDSSNHEVQLMSLRDSLKILQSMTNDAERRQGKESDCPIRLWLQHRQMLAFDVEDVLDERDYEQLCCDVETLGEKKRKRSSFSSDIVDKIKDMNVRFDELKEHARLLNLESHEFHPTAMQLPKTDSVLGDSKVFGRGDDIERILGILDDLREKQYLVSGVSIVGMGGLGKTTVARSIYKKAKEEKHYDLIAWVCVSEDFNEETILREMHEHFKGGVPPSSINVLVEGLAKELEKKNFLLVLDDVWNKDKSKWIAFNSRLSGILRTMGNSIMVTTHDEEVALEMRKMNLMRNSMQIYKMQKLSYVECWSIIEKTVLELSGLQSISPNLKDIGVDIAKKCGGLPLIAAVMGGTLSSEIQKGAWEAIRDNDAWNLDSKDGKWILSILKISYDHLLPHLKKCFSYCSIFPKDFIIEKDYLVQLWMAQGFLHQPNESSTTMEEIGDAYFNHLLSNSLFQDVRRNIYRDIISCKMHDIVHDLALAVSKDETLILKSGCKIDKNTTILHLRVKHDGSGLPNIPTYLHQRLRSLFIEEDADVFNKMASDLKSLRSLKLVQAKTEELCPALGELKHLRYLDISNGNFKALPGSLSKLYHLQTLRLKGNHVEVLEGFQPHSNLKSLSIDYDMGKSFPPWMMSGGATFLSNNLVELKLGDWHNCEHIPSLGLLPCLKFLYIHNFKNVKRMGHKFDSPGGEESIKLFPALRQITLKNMAILEEWVEVDDDDIAAGGKVKIVFPSLESLTIIGCHKLKTWLMGGFSSHHKLSSLEIYNCDNLMAIPNFNELSSLKKFDIYRCHALTSLPNGLGSCISLQYLCISSCINVRSIPEECLFYLTSLKKLKMGPFCKELEEFPGLNYIDRLSSSLEDLLLEGWDKLKSLPYQLQDLTALRKLTLKKFNRVEAFPERLGNLTSLQQLYIFECRNLTHLFLLQALKSLYELEMGPFSSEMEEFPGLYCIHHLYASLKYLRLKGWEK